MTSNLEKYNNAFIDTFDVDESELEGLAYKKSSGWDSVGHMMLVAAIDGEFDIELETGDISGFESYVEGKKLLRKYDLVIE